MGKSAWDTVTDRALWLEDGVTGLPPGEAGQRYRCLACGETLILKGSKPGAKVAPYFSHPGEKACTRPDREARVDAEIEVVLQLRDTIRAIPGVTAEIEILDTSPQEDMAPPAPEGLPPSITCSWGESTVVIERPGPVLPEEAAVRRRIRAVHARYRDAEHVWFLRKDPYQFGRIGTLRVRHSGRYEEHHTVAPTQQQLAIVAAGGSVYWLDGQLVLVPYGVRWFDHPAGDREDWSRWPRWRSDPRRDWRISKPQPAPDADCWGLVPLALTSMTRGRAVFRPAEAHAVMDALYASQQARHQWRRNKARKIYAQRHQPPSQQPPPVTHPRNTAGAALDTGTGLPATPQEREPLDTAAADADLGNATASAETTPPPPTYPPRPAAAPEPAPKGRWRRWLRGLRRRAG